MSKKKISYNEAVTEIEEILRKIEAEELDVDDLAENVKKAADLIKVCKAKLFKTESDIEQIIKNMDA